MYTYTRVRTGKGIKLWACSPYVYIYIYIHTYTYVQAKVSDFGLADSKESFGKGTVHYMAPVRRLCIACIYAFICMCVCMCVCTKHVCRHACVYTQKDLLERHSALHGPGNTCMYALRACMYCIHNVCIAFICVYICVCTRTQRRVCMHACLYVQSTKESFGKGTVHYMPW